MAKVVKYVNTVGLNTWIGKKLRLVRVSFAIMDDDTVVATVESAHNLSTIKSCGKITMTRKELADMPEDPYNDIVFAKAAFSLFGLGI